MPGVVVGVQEFVRPAGSDVQVEAALDAFGQCHIQAAVVRIVHRELSQVAGRGELRDPTGTVRIAAQPDRIGPAGGVGDANAAVGHGPAHAQGLAASRHARQRLRTYRFHLQVRIGNRHDVDLAQRCGAVVAFPAVLEYLALRIGHHEQAVAAAGIARQLHGYGVGVGLAVGQRSVVRGLRNHPVVRIAQHGILRQHDLVGPLRAAAGPGTVVAHAVGYVEGGRVGNGAQRCRDIRNR